MASTNTNTPTNLGVDYAFIAYVLFAILIGLGSAYYAVKNQKTTLAIAIVISSIAIFWFFGSRWFNGFKLKQEMLGGVDRTLTWPPQINYCPDFLSLISNNNFYYCVDTMGLSTLNLYTQGSSPTDNNSIQLYQFYNTIGNTSGTLNFLKNSLITKKLTWEGIYDGTSFSNVPIPSPYPPSAA